MAEAARVGSLQALSTFRAAFGEFKDAASLALTNAESDIQRTIWWLQQEQLTHWQQQIRRRQHEVANAKSELHRAQISAQDTRASCAAERKMLEKAKRRLEEAEWKVQRVRHWTRVLEREFLLYRGQTQRLASLLDREVPKGMARLASMIDHLEAYVKIAPPAGSTSPGVAPDADAKGPDDDAPAGAPT